MEDFSSKPTVKDSIEDGLRLRLLNNATPKKALKYALAFAVVNKDRPVALAIMASSILPENLARNLKNSLAGIDKKSLPFKTEELEIFKEGWHSDSFLLKNKKTYEIFVVKILRGRYGDIPHQQIKQQLEKEWRMAQKKINHNNLPYKIVPDEFFAVVDAGKREAAVIVQKFFGKNVKDLIYGMTVDEILDLANSDTEFKLVLKYFITTVLNSWKDDGILYDLQGKGNLLIMQNKTTKKFELHFVDPHDIISNKATIDKKILEKRLGYLKHLKKILSKI